MRPAVRLAALMQLPAIYVWTHDSIGLGEDGPTHQPVEHLASLRNIPGLDVVRPGDANETSICWRTIIKHTDRPAGIVLSRQNIPVLDRGDATGYAPADGAARGGYILAEAAGGSVGVEHYGASADYQTLYRQFGITADAVAAAARDSIHDAQHGTRPGGHPATFAPNTGVTADRPRPNMTAEAASTRKART